MISFPHFLGCLLFKLKLEKVLCDLVSAQERGAGVFDQDSTDQVLLDDVVVDVSNGFACS